MSAAAASGVARLRAAARTAFDAGVAAADLERATRSAEALIQRFVAGAAGQVVVVGLGKGAVPMARGVVDVLADRIDGGVVVGPPGTHGVRVGPLEVLAGDHPVPGNASAAAGERILDVVDGLGLEDRVIALVSGGGSALAAVPVAGLSVDDCAAASTVLMDAGLPVAAVNAIRARLGRVGGGGLARASAPAPVLSLVASDVVGDPLEVIASGPTVVRRSDAGLAFATLSRPEVVERLPVAVRDAVRTALDGAGPTGSAVEHEVVCTCADAARGAADALSTLGFEARILSTSVAGDAAGFGRFVGALAAARPDRRPVALVFAGETTVRVRGTGSGGRNQEVALAAAGMAAGISDVVVLAAGTDGVDGPTDVAGAVVDGQTIARIRAAGLDPDRALRDNDSYPVLAAAADHLRTGPTGTNVMDLTLVVFG